MKTSNEHFFQRAHKFKIQPLCVNVLSLLSYSLWQLPLQGLQSGLVQMTTRFFIPKMIVHVCRDLLAGIVALVRSFTASKRIYVGLGVMLVVAPLSYYGFMAFDRGHHIFINGIHDCGWYHHNLWHLFFLIRYQIAGVVFLLGLYIVLSKNPLAKFISLYMGFILMGLVMNVLAESNDDIWDTMNATLWGAGVALSLTIFLLIDWLTHRQFHQKDSFEAREKGLYQIADDVSPEKFKSMVLETWRKKFEFNSK